MKLAPFVMNQGLKSTPEAAHFAACLQRVATAKDREAFGILFDYYGPRIKSFMQRKGCNVEQAEDLVQETMITVWSKAHLFSEDRGAVSTWIFTIARNAFIDRLRRDKSQLYSDLEDFDAPDPSTGAEEALGRSQEDNHVAIALAQIPVEQRELLILSFVDNVTQSDIALRLNIPLGTVKSRMRLGYQRLRQLLENLT